MFVGGSAMNAAARTSAFWSGSLKGSAATAPALQRVQGGRTPRKVLSDACDPEESAKMRRKAKKLKYYTSKKS